jgi:hypothetical protein
MIILPLLCAALQAAQAPAPPSLTRFLQQSIGFDQVQLAAMQRGEAVVKVLDARDRRDVVVFGLATAAVSRATFASRMRDFPQSLKAPTRTQLGIFSTPAGAADVAGFTLARRDVEEMKDCKPGDCVVKLPAADMRRIRERTNWSAPDLQAQLSAFARLRMVEYVRDYRARGDSAMAIYDDRATRNIRSSEAFAAQVAESPYMYRHIPSLAGYLATYPRGTLPGAAEAIYWSEDALPRLRPILSITHLVVYDPPELPGATIVAAKQIYANHYFETALDVTAALDRPAGGSYILVLRRYRFDNLPGGILNIRGKAIGALRDQLLADLRRY